MFSDDDLSAVGELAKNKDHWAAVAIACASDWEYEQVGVLFLSQPWPPPAANIFLHYLSLRALHSTGRSRDEQTIDALVEQALLLAPDIARQHIHSRFQYLLSHSGSGPEQMGLPELFVLDSLLLASIMSLFGVSTQSLLGSVDEVIAQVESHFPE